MLQDFGFDVLEAEHADAALQHLEANDGVVVLYTDVRMPCAQRDGLGLERGGATLALYSYCDLFGLLAAGRS